jgi:hypothetical protein
MSPETFTFHSLSDPLPGTVVPVRVPVIPGTIHQEQITKVQCKSLNKSIESCIEPLMNYHRVGEPILSLCSRMESSIHKKAIFDHLFCVQYVIIYFSVYGLALYCGVCFGIIVGYGKWNPTTRVSCLVSA